MIARKGDGGEWEWVLVYVDLEVKGIWKIREYMRRQQKTLAEYVSGRKIYKLFKGAEKMESFSRFPKVVKPRTRPQVGGEGGLVKEK